MSVSCSACGEKLERKKALCRYTRIHHGLQHFCNTDCSVNYFCGTEAEAVKAEVATREATLPCRQCGIAVPVGKTFYRNFPGHAGECHFCSTACSHAWQAVNVKQVVEPEYRRFVRIDGGGGSYAF